jgi:glutathione synthase/RimK-type ligase-like ATP-grasp enzyme
MVFQGKGLSKSEECSRLGAAGMPVPCWALLTPEVSPDTNGLGEYVVMKPDIGGRGADIKIVRRDRVRWREQKTQFAGRSPNWIVQEFIYTGPWPVSYRVATLFGNALWAIRIEADNRRYPLKERYGFRGAGSRGGMSIVSSGKGCEIELCDDQEIIELAESAHLAFPDIPLLGVDILREEPTGNLYIIEVNAVGYTWHFTSPKGKQFQKHFNFCLESQFDGIRKAARILAEKTREFAV